MKILSRTITLLFIVTLLVSACKSKSNNSFVPPSAAHKVVVKEQIQTSNYTYFRVTEDDSQYWIAGIKMEAKVGETLYYNTSYVMEGFVSTELNRTFNKVLFIQDLSKNPAAGIQMGMPSGETQMGTPSGVQMGTPQQQQGDGFNVVDPINRENLEIVEQEISLDELFTNYKKYGDKLVKISGKIIKVNSAIMGTNWIHMSTLVKDLNNYDLTITSNETVKVGDELTIEGKITLNKDFGSGYSFSIMMEDGIVISK